MAPANNILVLAVTRLGDMLQSSPTFVGLKRQHPGAKITVLVDKAIAPVCAGIAGIDQIYPMELSMLLRQIHFGKEGIVEAYKYIDDTLAELRKRNFDMIFNLSSSPYTAILMKMLGIKNSRGWISDDEGFRLITEPWAMLFAAFVFHSNRDYNSINLVDILRCSVGVNQHPRHLVYEISKEGLEFGEKFFVANDIDNDGPIIALQAGASQEKRQWDPPLFAKLIKMFIEQMNARVILTGTPSELKISEQILKLYNHPRICSAIGKTNIPQLASLLKKSDVLVTGDTGTMHLSIATGTPVVAAFLASAYCFETGPYGPGNFVLQPQIECGPCNPNFRCFKTDCHNHITPEMIYSLVQIRLETPQGEEDRIVLPDPLKNQKLAAIYLTQFDQDGFLEFRHLAGENSKNGLSAKIYNLAKNSYRALWKEEFEKINYPALPPGINRELDSKNFIDRGLAQAIELSHEGISKLEKLAAAVNDLKTGPDVLRELNSRLAEIDKEIEYVGLSCPVLGAIIRIFLMEKENIRGDEILNLASDNKSAYQRLLRRSHRFADLFKHFEERVAQ